MTGTTSLAFEPCFTTFFNPFFPIPYHTQTPTAATTITCRSHANLPLRDDGGLKWLLPLGYHCLKDLLLVGETELSPLHLASLFPLPVSHFSIVT